MLVEATSLEKLLFYYYYYFFFVKCLKYKGHVVAIIGQSDRDAHAFKGVDVGIHIGFQGNNNAMENFDIIVLHGSFVSTIMAL